MPIQRVAKLMRRHVLLLLALGCTLCCCSRPVRAPNGKSTTSAESKKALIRDAFQLRQAGDLSGLDRVVAPEYVGHVSAGDRDLQGLRERIGSVHRLYADVVFHIEDQMADGDKVVTRLSAEVTLRDSDKRAKLIGINISRIAHGQIVEEWETWESLATEPVNSRTR